MILMYVRFIRVDKLPLLSTVNLPVEVVVSNNELADPFRAEAIVIPPPRLHRKVSQAELLHGVSDLRPRNRQVVHVGKMILNLPYSYTLSFCV